MGNLRGLGPGRLRDTGPNCEERSTVSAFHVPFDQGIRQDISPAVAPEGFAARVQNGRIPRAGGVARRYGATDVPVSTTGTAGGSAAFGGDLPHGAAAVGDKQMIALSGRAFARDFSTAPTWQE